MPDIGQALVSTIAELNANLRNMREQAEAGIHGFYKEVRRMIKAFDNRQLIGVRPITVSITVNVTSGGTGSSADFKIGDTEDFVVYECRGYLSFDDWNSAPAVTVTAAHVLADAGATVDAMPPTQRAYMKASNCKINLKVKDNKLPITDGTGSTDIPLSAIMAEFGCRPLMWGGDTRPSWVIPHGVTITMTASLQKSNTFLNADSTDYGVILTGLYMTRTG